MPAKNLKRTILILSAEPPANLPGPLQQLPDARNRNAVPVKLSDWLCRGSLGRARHRNLRFIETEDEVFAVGKKIVFGAKPFCDFHNIVLPGFIPIHVQLFG